MCGIAGTIGIADTSIANTMLAALHHRGPDQQGVASLGPVAMGTTRLAIVDPIGGSQPIYNEDRSLCLVFNGEIYNHDELRSKLQAQGHTFLTASDTEVIVHLFEQYGESCVEHLRGMFCFAIGNRLKYIDGKSRIVPLYCCPHSDHSHHSLQIPGC